jgi:energy-converting hydrogenase Eha subunit F
MSEMNEAQGNRARPVGAECGHSEHLRHRKIRSRDPMGEYDREGTTTGHATDTSIQEAPKEVVFRAVVARFASCERRIAGNSKLMTIKGFLM